ncbi:prolyl oligopeptidase family serine peptidase [Propionivibrio sp.]|uniref:alpha/beta hydrolase family protein n=1 Tax=Propionivibrio sp. TaxID=2212460 RepID=UPI00261DE153|nr:prolyl oligopeptidase family serine peptidase [Propionivibrio sp.]
MCALPMEVLLWLVVMMWLPAASTYGAPCMQPDNIKRVSGDTECLLIKTFRHDQGLAMSTLFVLLHGNHSSGSPAVSQFPVAATLARSGPEDTVAVAVIRPGYNDAEGNFSSGNAAGRADNFYAGNIDIVAAAIDRLKAFHQPQRLVLVGHSGGAAMAGVILGRHPGLADAAVLVGCPCNVPAWRSMRGRRDHWNSESAERYVERMPLSARVAVLVGAKDDVTPPLLAQSYAIALAARGIAHELLVLPDQDHVTVIDSAQVVEAALRLGKAD